MKRTFSYTGMLAAVSIALSAGVCGAQEDQPIVAHIRMSGQVLESAPEMVLFGEGTYMTLQDWLKRLAAARTDDKIAAVALEIASPQVSWAQSQELADAVRRLNEVKPVYTYLASGGPREHLIAAAGRELTLCPTGQLTIVGVGMELLFLRGTLDKLGITPQMIQIGPYKGAAEPLQRTEPSEPLKEQYNWLLDDLYSQLVGQLAESRKLTKAQARAAIDEGLIPAARAKQLKLVDRLMDGQDWEAHVRAAAAPRGKECKWVKSYAKKKDDSFDLSNPFALLGAILKGKPAERIVEPTIAIINASGMIVTGRGGESLFGTRMIGSRTMARCFRKVTDDNRIKAVVFRIDSPGGSAHASEEIYQAVRRCAAAKPVIVSMGSMGASGGYYIACGASEICADEASIVGSIGVMSGKLALSGLLEKIGVSRYEMTRGKQAGLGMTRPWTEAEQAVVRASAQRVYDLFVNRVKAGRGAKIAKLDKVTGGRVFTARQAKANGLIDSVGGFREAVAQAQKAAGVDKAHFVTYPKPRGLIDILKGDSDDEDASAARLMRAVVDPYEAAALRLLPANQKAGLGYLLNLAALLAQENVAAAMPCHLGIR
ncbi:MAG TPA: signal peptide peptidase SppA [Phycisphaerae bacterium]|nr:signal peptide peptidase SppA [Phycisphaerae bacterium]HUT60157.1 signal peptide peptidase SppA [Phycisphaerae bacterium]